MNARGWWVAALVVAALAGGRGQARAGEVTVAVAANFADAARHIASRFEETTGHELKISVGSTGMLFSQIENGAPFDVFIAADSERPARAEREGLAVPGTRFTYATGRLVLWSATPGRFEDGETYVRTLSFSRVAIANPATAPYGAAARQVLERLQVWERARPRLVQGENVAQTFQFTATGNADVGFVALSQVMSWPRGRGTVWEIPRDYYRPINQQAVLLVNGADNPAARAFLDFLTSTAAREDMLGYGYGVE